MKLPRLGKETPRDNQTKLKCYVQVHELTPAEQKSAS